MKLYSSKAGTNPRAAHIMLGFKGIEVERIEVDIVTAENRAPAFLQINPAGTLPCLVTDDGFSLTETTAIAEYLEEIKPDPMLVGATAVERAETRMWARRMDMMVIMPMANGYRHGEAKAFFEGRIQIYEDLSPPSKKLAIDGLRWLDAQLADKTYLCGDRFTYADIVFYCHVSLFAKASLPIPEDMAAVNAYMARLAAHEVIVNHSKL